MTYDRTGLHNTLGLILVGSVNMVVLNNYFAKEWTLKGGENYCRIV